MKFFGVLTQVLFLALPVSITAAPIDAPKDIDLAKRACPTVDTVVTWLIDYSSVGDNTVFYTSGAGQQAAADLAAEVGGSWFGSAFGNQLTTWLDECDGQQDENQLIAVMSEALARRSTGATYVVLGQYPIGTDSVWLRNEYPNLTGVSSITAVNARDLSQRQGYTPHQNPWSS
ncbi:hypothetical protein Micbo1qcDRAFT_205589 [Microdochium bolleyi]|uniref:Uncharacterized protein n=1 Tax=Microdochium bolleyi TaxID=196109 RepID=A0A136IYB4_9PEZI|nr:hypothetical protein Micbo1qcDRAFT_205589 [Microdochium bolleyi]